MAGTANEAQNISVPVQSLSQTFSGFFLFCLPSGLWPLWLLFSSSMLDTSCKFSCVVCVCAFVPVCGVHPYCGVNQGVPFRGCSLLQPPAEGLVGFCAFAHPLTTPRSFPPRSRSVASLLLPAGGWPASRQTPASLCHLCRFCILRVRVSQCSSSSNAISYRCVVCVASGNHPHESEMLSHRHDDFAFPGD